MQKYHNFSTKSGIAYYAFPDLVEKLGWFQQAPFQNLKYQIWKFKTLVSSFKKQHIKKETFEIFLSSSSIRGTPSNGAITVCTT